MRILLILSLFFLHVNAKEIEASYDITYGIIGKVGKAKAKFITNKDKTYTIQIEANTTGFAKALSGGRNEFFQSSGKILEDGSLSPKVYRHIATRMKRKNSFTLDPNKWKKVLSKKVTTINFEDKKITEHKIKSLDNEVYSKSEKVLNYYAKNDLLSLFFNFKVLSNDFNLTKKTTFHAVGAGDKNGKLDILPMPKKFQIQLFEDKKGYNFIATINKPVFASDKGELFMKLDKDGICTIAVLKDVLLFGDIKGVLVKKNVR